MAATEEQLEHRFDSHSEREEQERLREEQQQEREFRETHQDQPPDPDPNGGPESDSGYQQTGIRQQDPSTVHGVVDPPPVPRSDGPGANNGEVAVDTSAFTQFVTNLGALKAMIDTSRGHVKNVNVQAGNFGAGYELSRVVNLPQGGLRSDTVAFMDSAFEVLHDVGTVMSRLAADYDSVEEINGISSNDLALLFQESYDGIAGLKDHGNSQSGTVGNGETSGTDEDKDDK